MNKKLISDALGLLDDRYLEEALDCPKSTKGRAWVKWGAMAACFSLVCAAALAFLPAQPEPAAELPSTAVPESSAPVVTAPTPVPSEPEALHIPMGNVLVNDEMDAPVSAARLYYDPALHDDVPWDRDTVINYFGRDLTPTYVPAGLDAYEGNGTTVAIIRKEDGEIRLDTVYYSYYQSFGTWEDGTTRYIDENAVRHGFTLTASRVGILNCGIVYIGPGDEIKTSDIAGVPVTIGYRAMSHGPYDPQTHEPAGYYDLYVAEFELDGVGLQLVADELKLEEVVRIVASVICPGQEIVLD